jgi:hypothetical protein
VKVPISPELVAAIDAMPKKHLTFLHTAHGKPRSAYGLANDFAKWAREAGLPNHCRLHGLKKAGMARRADAGLGINPAKPKPGQIEPPDKDINHANRIILANLIFQAFRKKGALAAIHPLNKAPSRGFSRCLGS